MIHLGIDFGEKRIGLAVSDAKEIVSAPLSIIKRVSDEAAISQILELAVLKKVEKIVVGMPQAFASVHETQVKRVSSFIEKLNNSTDIPIETFTEAYTSKIAHTQRKGKRPIDDLAAAHILQRYLDSRL
ncbi:Holliday junction resolvase RuvX [Candidatus Dojkabacteria bacterium]|nr:Holliday junction resolvase RuvX [Candidatus Dojkabacteria bacterium]